MTASTPSTSPTVKISSTAGEPCVWLLAGGAERNGDGDGCERMPCTCPVGRFAGPWYTEGGAVGRRGEGGEYGPSDGDRTLRYGGVGRQYFVTQRTVSGGRVVRVGALILPWDSTT